MNADVHSWDKSTNPIMEKTKIVLKASKGISTEIS
jgi:hypothetical protein